MDANVLASKSATIERCIARARGAYSNDAAGFSGDIDRQDIAVLNIQRACEACIDMGNLVIRRDRLGLPQSARDVFALLATAGIIGVDLANRLERMVGYRNIAVHDYKKLSLQVTISIIKLHLDDFAVFSEEVMKAAGAKATGNTRP